MTRHQWNRRTQGPPPSRDRTGLWVVVGCLVFAALAGGLAVDFFVRPTQCDSTTMQSGDRCESSQSIWSKNYHERLIPADSQAVPRGRTVDEQRVTNRNQGLLRLGGSLFFLVIVTPVVVGGVRNRLDERYWRRHRAPGVGEL
ncbi:MAG: hypothetical protein QM658_09720 [Gordonia sp. (in: high G+C Gram-positive bacteria)]